MLPTTQSRPLIGVGVVIWRGEQILLGKRPGERSGKRGSDNDEAVWQFPGGHLEVDESVTACAAREVKEETALLVQGYRHLGYTEKTFTVAEKRYMTLLVSCEYAGGMARVMEPDKCTQWRWFDYRMLPQHMPGPLFEPIEIFMSQLDAFPGGDLLALHRSSLLICED
jgi:8-oxo-dGTP diphosphatase